VGRAALDEDAIRRIEEQNPFIEFDWSRILKGQGAPQESRQAGENRRRESNQPRHGAPRPQQQPSATAPPSTFASAAPPASSASAIEPDAQELQDVVLDAGDAAIADFEEAVSSPQAADRAADEDAAGEHSAPVDETWAVAILDAVAVDPEVPIPAHARLGPEGVARLRARYRDTIVQIGESVADPIRRDELKAKADLISPDLWTTDEEVLQGLEKYETVLASLRDVVGRRRRRRRGGRGVRAGSDPSAVSPTSESEAPAERTDSGFDDI
jgi:hypothetical protein